MRICPKCGTTYSDSDLRTICSSCLVNLVTVADVSAIDEMATPGPISLGPITPPSAGTTELPTLPDVPLPAAPVPSTGDIEMPVAPAPVLPDIPLPAPPTPREGDIPADMPPPPLPPTATVPAAPEQPPAVPAPADASLAAPASAADSLSSTVTEELAAEEQTIAELTATAPTAPDASATAPPPMGPDTSGHPPGPVMLDLDLPPANPAPPPLERAARPAAPTRSAAPSPAAPTGWGSQDAVPAAITTRALPDNAMSSGQARTGGFTFLAFICAIIALGALFSTRAEDFGPFTLLVVGGLIAATVVCVRKAIYYSAIGNVRLSPAAPPMLGVTLPVQVSLEVLRDIPVTDVTVTLTARERAIDSGNKNTTYTQVIYEQTARIVSAPRWQGGQQTSFTANMLIPANAQPSFAGKYNFIEWSAKLWVGIPGWYPDVRVQAPVTVRPLTLGAPPLVTGANQFSAPMLPGLDARLTVQSGSREGRPVLQAGGELPFTLTIAPTEAHNDQRLRVELGYHITGAGTHEDRNVAVVSCFPAGWSAGPQEISGVLRVPPDVPMSYEGHHLRARWTLSLRHEAPWQFDKLQTIDVVVIPASLPAPESGQ